MDGHSDGRSQLVYGSRDLKVFRPVQYIYTGAGQVEFSPHIDVVGIERLTPGQMITWDVVHQ